MRSPMTAFDWKTVVRTVVACLYYYSGLFSIQLWWSRRSHKNVLILTLHRVLPAHHQDLRDHLSLRSIIVTCENFAAALSFLQKHFKFLALSALPRMAQNQAARRHSHCVVTFDDGYCDFLEYAWPILQHHRVPATLFVPTALIGTSHSFWWDEVYCLGMRLQGSPLDQIPPEIAARLNQIAAVSASQRPRLIYALVEYLQDWPQPRVRQIGETRDVFVFA